MNAAKRKVSLNSLGEVFLDESLVFGSVNLNSLGLPESVILSDREEDKKRINDACEAKTQEKLREALTEDELSFVNSVFDKQSLNDSRFRIYGYTEDESHAVLVTEFTAFVDDKDAWKEINEAAKNAGCAVRTMIEHPHLDKSKKVDDKEWTIGPNHNRMERQVEVFCDVTAPNIDGIRERIEEIKIHTNDIWPKYGVDVL